MTSRASAGNNTLQANGLCVFVHVYLCLIFLKLVFFIKKTKNKKQPNLTNVIFLNRNVLANCYVQSYVNSCSFKNQTNPYILVRPTCTVNNMEAW